MHISFNQFSVLRSEEQTEARNCDSSDHNKHSFFMPFLCTILYGNLQRDKISTQKFIPQKSIPQKMSNVLYTSWQEPVTGCNNSNCLVITSSQHFASCSLNIQCWWTANFVDLLTTLLFTIVLTLTVPKECTNHVISFATIHSSGWLHFNSGGNSASCLFRISVAVSFTGPCDARPLRSGELWLSDGISIEKSKNKSHYWTANLLKLINNAAWQFSVYLHFC